MKEPQSSTAASPDDAPETPAPLAVRLVRIRTSLRRVPKRGYNAHHKYHYATEADIKAAVSDALDREQVLVVPMVAGDVRHEGTLTTVPMTFRAIAADTGEVLDVPWAGVGFDKGGDKGIYKAFTGATKYVLMGMFLMETGDDPERDNTSAKASGGRTASVPAIPRDRAQRIVKAAKDAGIDATVWKAKLAEVGAEKVTRLTVDQAEDVEAFIRQEGAAGA